MLQIITQMEKKMNFQFAFKFLKKAKVSIPQKLEPELQEIGLDQMHKKVSVFTRAKNTETKAWIMNFLMN